MDNIKIPTYIINLKDRTDRKMHILNEFSTRDEFTINIIEPCCHKVGAVSLWNSIKQVLQNLIPDEDDFVLICEDDHQFTQSYSKEALFNCIKEAKKLDADIILGGVSWFEDGVQISDNLFWVRRFTGTQFMIIFKTFFRTIINAPFDSHDCADYKICSLTNNYFVLNPFISTQKDFGYSDVTNKNNLTGRVEALFKSASVNATILKEVATYYKKRVVKEIERKSFENITIPTYIINLQERTERREHIEQQFAGKTEFDINIVEACKHKIGAVGLWYSIRKIIEIAIENDDDVIIICEDDHEFTEYYSKEILLQNIIEAHEEGIDYLSGGTAYFKQAIPVSKNRYWINPSNSTQFIIVYKKFFNPILAEPFDDNVIADIFLSKITSNKMVLYPFISTQKDFGYSDVTPIHNSTKDFVKNSFANAANRLEITTMICRKYNLI